MALQPHRLEIFLLAVTSLPDLVSLVLRFKLPGQERRAEPS